MILFNASRRGCATTTPTAYNLKGFPLDHVPMKSVNLFFHRPLCTSTVPKTLSTADTSNGNTTSVCQPTISLPDKLKESLNKILSSNYSIYNYIAIYLSSIS